MNWNLDLHGKRPLSQRDAEINQLTYSLGSSGIDGGKSTQLEQSACITTTQIILSVFGPLRAALQT